MYCKRGDTRAGQIIFEKMPEKNFDPWNKMLVAWNKMDKICPTIPNLFLSFMCNCTKPWRGCCRLVFEMINPRWFQFDSCFIHII